MNTIPITSNNDAERIHSAMRLTMLLLKMEMI